jgi:hypothetical protein
MNKRCHTNSHKNPHVACGQLKPLEDFHFSKITNDSFDNLCRICRKAVKDQHANKPHIREKRRIYSMKPALKQKRKIYSQTHKAERNEYEKRKRREDPLFKLKHSIRTRTNNFLRCRGISKGTKMEKLIGCPWYELRIHIEKQFSPGMTWKNHSRTGWHVDHIIALSTLTDEDIKDSAKVNALFHYSNLRPLWYDDNIRRTPKHPKY